MLTDFQRLSETSGSGVDIGPRRRSMETLANPDQNSESFLFVRPHKGTLLTSLKRSLCCFHSASCKVWLPSEKPEIIWDTSENIIVEQLT